MLQHLAIIMDGNRRWAKTKNLPAFEGHRKGYEKLKEVAKWCAESKVKILTVYAFSTENWNRSKAEVTYLMQLLENMFKKDISELHKNNVKITVIGQKERLSKKLQQLISDAEEKTARNKKLHLQIAMSYGGRQEIVQAVKEIVKQKIIFNKINETIVKNNLWTVGVPDPDLIVRTSGEQRLSNFLSWQSAYSELLFIKKHWPAFTKRDFLQVLREYDTRQRRYGK